MCQDMCFGCFDANQARAAAMGDQRDEWESFGWVVINSVSRVCMAPRMNDHVVNRYQRIEGDGEVSVLLLLCVSARSTKSTDE